MGKIDLTERIRQRAYAIWESEGRPHGLDHVHWLRAEAEIGGDVKPRVPIKRPTTPTQNPTPTSAPSPKPSSKLSQKQPPKR